MRVPRDAPAIRYPHTAIIDCGDRSVEEALAVLSRPDHVCTFTIVFKPKFRCKARTTEHVTTLHSFRIHEGALLATVDKICGMGFTVPLSELVVTVRKPVLELLDDLHNC